MLIALDYDGTFTADPEYWIQIIDLTLRRGHEMVLATMRHEHELDDIDPRLKSRMQIVPTGRKAKKKALSLRGIEPDIWIDDTPEWLFTDARS